jgi:hypothetical protein
LLPREIGATLVMGMEDKETSGTRPATYTSGNPVFTRASPAVHHGEGFADARLGLPPRRPPPCTTAIGAWNLEPVLAFQHDVQGTTP